MEQRYLKHAYNTLEPQYNYPHLLKTNLAVLLILKHLIMKLKHIFYSFCFATAMFACANEPLVEPNDTLLEADLKGIANAPETSGQYVIRTEDFVWAWVISDPKTELTAVVGWDYEAQLAWCAGEFNFDLFDQVPSQIVNNPSSESRIILLNQGPVRVIVFDGYYDYSYPNCDFFTSAEVIAEGQANFIQTDNDLIAYLNDSNNKNAYSIRANGNLLSRDNEQMHLNVFWQFLWDKDPESGFFDDLVKVSVQLH